MPKTLYRPENTVLRNQLRSARQAAGLTQVDLSAAIGKNSDKHAFFNKANFLLFNLAVGGDFPNIHNADNVTAIPAGGAEMLVDYVRVYQPKKQISLNIKK